MGLFTELFITNETKKISVIGLTKELKSLYIYNHYINNDKAIVLLTSSLYEANNYCQSLINYTSDVLLFPMDDFLTSEALAISPELKTTRLETLNNLTNNSKKIIITNLMGYLRYLPQPALFNNRKIVIKINQEYSISKLIEDLFLLGYTRETVVNKTGEIAIRGFVVDIFPNNTENPVRIEYWGDTIESIRIFNLDSQLTKENIDNITVFPNTEFLISDQTNSFSQKDIIKYGEVANINNYVTNALVVYDDYNQIEVSNRLLVEEIFNYNVSINGDKSQLYMHDFYDIKPKNELFLMNFDNAIKGLGDTENYTSSEIEPFTGNNEAINKRLNGYLAPDKQVVICLSNKYKINKIIEALDNPNVFITNENEIFPNKINIIMKQIKEGFIYKNLIVISEKEIFNKKETTNVYKTNFKIGIKIRDISKLSVGDYVVHSVHGIGRYNGIKTISKNGLNKDYLQVEYRDGDKLYIPVEKIDYITKYSVGDGAIPKISKLGSIEWEKTKLRVQRKVENIAGELLKLYAEREAKEGFSFAQDDEEQIAFEKEFPYVETIDQLKVTEEIKKDMESSHPMDRLLCGDVGFGKTEVAFRAMFKAILSGKQVMFLCPTTILSKQHYNNAIERFKSFPVNVAILNRFVTTKETKRIISGIEKGTIDIVIGTHRLLSDDIIYKNLGLLVVDEEQRFGVKHKEKVKQYKTNIDVLTLSATPIPRTIQMSLSGIRSLSLIETPPINRYPIQTYVLAENNQIIKDAIYKELSRHGQIFMLYNSVRDMPTKVAEISRLVPDARVISAHGKMGKSEIENVMVKFVNREYDVLVCTTIIETGIDIPSANTLIIIDADNFGLSQLYQIRGRVGRSNKIAYCYLMYNPGKILTEIATKRLKVIKEFTELGSGFAIAMRDLSIRGAGDILGSEQAGFVDAVGIELFLRMLNAEIQVLKGETVIEEVASEAPPLINVATSIDSNYVMDEELKIEIHKKINMIDSYASLQAVKNEIEDRFGTINEEMTIYMYQEWFEKLAHKIGVNKINQSKEHIEIMISKELAVRLNGEKLFVETYKISQMFRFSMKFGRLLVTLDITKLDKHFIYYLIEFLELLEKSIKKTT